MRPLRFEPLVNIVPIYPVSTKLWYYSPEKWGISHRRLTLWRKRLLALEGAGSKQSDILQSWKNYRLLRVIVDLDWVEVFSMSKNWKSIEIKKDNYLSLYTVTPIKIRTEWKLYLCARNIGVKILKKLGREDNSSTSRRLGFGEDWLKSSAEKSENPEMDRLKKIRTLC